MAGQGEIFFWLQGILEVVFDWGNLLGLLLLNQVSHLCCIENEIHLTLWVFMTLIELVNYHIPVSK